MASQWDELRDDFPAAKRYVYLNAAAGSPTPRPVTEAVAAFGALRGSRHLVGSGSRGGGAFPVDVKAAGVDALASAGHKGLCAGYGAGFLYVSKQLLGPRPPRAIGWLSVRRPFAFDNVRF